MTDDHTPTTEPNVFDRYLAAFERAVAARAWDEGFCAAEEQHDGYAGVSGWTKTNPYREECARD